MSHLSSGASGISSKASSELLSSGAQSVDYSAVALPSSRRLVRIAVSLSDPRFSLIVALPGGRVFAPSVGLLDVLP